MLKEELRFIVYVPRLFFSGGYDFFSSEIAVQQLSADGFGNLRSHVSVFDLCC